jgi:arginase
MRWSGAATSTGSHRADQERAPGALREAGLGDRLRAAGLAVDDVSDVVREMFRPDRGRPAARNLEATCRAALAVSDVVARVPAHGGRPVVLGGDCTITLGCWQG